MRQVVVAVLQLTAALTIVALLFWLEWKGVEAKWVNLIGMSCLVFGYLCYLSKALWRKKRYWVSLVALLALHGMILVQIQRSHMAVPLPYYMLMVPIEGGIIYYILLRVAG